MKVEPLYMAHYESIVIAISLANSAALDAAREAEKELCHCGYEVTDTNVFKGPVRDYVQRVGHQTWENKLQTALGIFGLKLEAFHRIFLDLPGHDLLWGQYAEGLITREEYVRDLSVRLRKVRG